MRALRYVVSIVMAPKNYLLIAMTAAPWQLGDDVPRSARFVDVSGAEFQSHLPVPCK